MKNTSLYQFIWYGFRGLRLAPGFQKLKPEEDSLYPFLEWRLHLGFFMIRKWVHRDNVFSRVRDRKFALWQQKHHVLS